VTDAVTVPSPRIDGRAERSRRTRTAVVDAMLALQEEGDVAPSAQRVADWAGISARTMYLHFADMEALFVEAGDRFLIKLTAIGRPVPLDAPLAERIELFCSRRAKVLETLLPVFRASRLRQPFSQALQANRDRYVLASDREVEAVFAAELAACPPRERSHLRSALYLATCAAGWDVLRDDRGLDERAAGQVMRRMVVGLLS